ncbi:unnamed protein product [Mytilus coruscus]|uniref:Uncharacterized protein n=1 Tax=Mytilus coruscus TaxID=42192 RepID=A0A6J8DEY4_MYTCO|nr:unnamed protein product [Mytilus coruscus]
MYITTQSNLLSHINSLSTPVPTFYEDELVKLRNRDWDNDSERLVQRIPTFTTCKTSLYNQRSKTIPQLSNSRQEINLEGKWRETTGDNFLLIDDGDHILIFSTHLNLSHLTAASSLYGDGTFYIALWMELCTHALLPGKDQATYIRFFQLLKDYCQ